ncbi:MAG: Crp/Fnr family transcriptional regulator [Candidimonas sp.]|nr:MAG: Crp/Fnr family transcriptional regulator [Candidimonas sp.]TAM77163.1 MAG: Crp/Fnr family transcriptional regulator [Candidimonas sp.]
MPAANAVLAALPRRDYRRLLSDLEPVTLAFGDVLHEAGTLIRHVYFPVDCVVCLLTGTAGQRTVETGLVGYEGVIGVSLALGVDVSSARAEVQSAGTALRMSAAHFNNAFRRCLPLQRELYRFTNTKLAQARQAAACFASHPLEQRLACWLLMTSDRSRSQEIFLTQEYLASVMNVRRESVTFSAGSLRTRNLISCHRGTIRILDRAGLETVSCSCYQPIESLSAK